MTAPAKKSTRGLVATWPTRLRRAAEQLSCTLPYEVTAPVLGRVGALWPRRAAECVTLRTLAAPGVAGRTLSEHGVVRRHLLTRWLGSARLQLLSRGAWPRQDSRWFSARGVEHVTGALAAGRRVLVANSHYGAAQCVPLMLARLGLRLHSVECCDPFRALGLERPPTLSVISTADHFLARVAVEARRALLEQGLICIAADGYVTQRGLTLPFHGRARTFAAGFAELALDADAVVVPASAPIDDRGRVALTIAPPLVEPDRSAPRAERRRALIEQYATWLAERWSADPGNVINLRTFMALPAWPASPSSPAH